MLVSVRVLPRPREPQAQIPFDEKPLHSRIKTYLLITSLQEQKLQGTDSVNGFANRVRARQSHNQGGSCGVNRENTRGCGGDRSNRGATSGNQPT